MQSITYWNTALTFTSFSYFVLLFATAMLVVPARGRLRLSILLGASYVLAFYAGDGTWYVPAVLFGVTLVTYIFGIGVGAARSESVRRWLCFAAIGFNVAVLILARFAAAGTVQGNVVMGLLSARHDAFGASPFVSIGISYYTLQGISYLIDVRLGLVEPERHLGRFALYLCFFPKFMQGPIERAGSLLPRLRVPHRSSYEDVKTGLIRIACGLVKKLVVADRLADYVDPVFASVGSYGGAVFPLATVAFAIQIYFDFSGYTDIALGSARLLGIDLTENFDRPYSARSVPEFWRRWHISFSRWILDYIFKPLQIVWRDAGRWGTALALVATFLLSGLWHGSAWGFVVWGLLHGLYMASSVIFRTFRSRLASRFGLESRPGLHAAMQRTLTFALICLAWVFFRAPTLSSAWFMIKGTFSPTKNLGELAMAWGEFNFALLVLVLVATFVVWLVRRRVDFFAFMSSQPRWLRWAYYYALILSILLFGNFKHTPFLYANF